MNHTPEPWQVIRTDNGTDIFYILEAGENAWRDSAIASLKKGEHGSAREGNAARIVSCINALAGIPDPAEFVAAAKELLKVCWPVFKLGCKIPFKSSSTELEELNNFNVAVTRTERAFEGSVWNNLIQVSEEFVAAAKDALSRLTALHKEFHADCDFELGCGSFCKDNREAIARAEKAFGGK